MSKRLINQQAILEKHCECMMLVSSKPLDEMQDSSMNAKILEFLRHFKGSQGKDSI